MPLGNRVAWSLPCWDLYVCVPWYARVITDFKRKKHIEKVGIIPLWARAPVWSSPAPKSARCPEGWQPSYSYWMRKRHSVPASCRCFEFWESSEGRVLWPPCLWVWPEPLVTVCLHHGYTGGLRSSSSSLFQQPATLVSGNHFTALAGFRSRF